VGPVDDADDEDAETGLFIGKVLKVIPSGKESTYEDKHDDDATIEVSELVCQADRTDAKCLKAQWWLPAKRGLKLSSYPAWSIVDYFEHEGNFITIPGRVQKTIQEVGMWEEE